MDEHPDNPLSVPSSEQHRVRRLGNIPVALNLLILVLGIIALGGKVADDRRLIRAEHEFIRRCVADGGRDAATAAMLRALLIPELEMKHNLPAGTLNSELPTFARRRAADTALPKLDRAAAAFAILDYTEAERLALEVSIGATKAIPRDRDTLIKAAELTVWSHAARHPYPPEPKDSLRTFRHFDNPSQLISKLTDPLDWARIEAALIHPGFSYYELNGRVRHIEVNGRSEPVLPDGIWREIVAIRSVALGPEHPDTLQSRHRLAEALRSTAGFADAEEEHRAVLAIRQRVLEPGHPDILASHIGVARSLWCREKDGRITFAEEKRVAAEKEAEYRTVLPFFQRLLGDDHLETLKIRKGFSEALHAQDKHAEAVAEDRSRIPIEERVLGADHFDTLLSRTRLAIELAGHGKYAEAEAEARTVLEIRRQREFQTSDPGLASSYMQVGQYVYWQGRFDEALQYVSQAEAIWDNKNPYLRNHNHPKSLRQWIERQVASEHPEHPTALRLRNDAAMETFLKGKYAQAEAEHRAVLAIRKRILGPEHPDTLMSWYHVARAIDAQRRSPEAETEHRNVLAIRERVLGPEHPDTLLSRTNVAASLAKQERHSEAETEYRAVLGIRQRVLGPEHPDTLLSRALFARNLYAQRRYSEAVAEHRATLAIRERVLGAKHPDVAQSYFNLALCLVEEGKKAEALTAARRSVEVWNYDPKRIFSDSLLASKLVKQLETE